MALGPALTGNYQEKLRLCRRMRADDTARFDRQAGQMDPAVACRDARGEESFAAETADDLLPAVELEDLHRIPFYEPDAASVDHDDQPGPNAA